MRRLLLLTALTTVAPATAHAATWTAPVTVSQTAHTFAGPVDLLAAGDGTLVAAWTWQDGAGTAATVGAATAGRPPQGAWGTERPAPAGLLDVAAYGRTRALALAQTPSSGNGPGGAQNQALRVAYARAGSAFGAARALTCAPILYRPQMAVSARGLGLVAWIEVTRTAAGATRRTVRAVQRNSGGFGAPATLSGRGRADTLAVAVGARGDQVLAIVRDGLVLARVRRPGRPWGPFATLARAAGATRWQLRAAVDARGQVRVVWRRHRLSRPGVPGRQALEGTYIPAGASAFKAAQQIEGTGASTFRLVEAPTGWALAYVHATPGGPRPAVRVTPARAAFGAVRYGAPAQGGIRGADVAFSSAAGLTLAWVQPVDRQGGDGLARSASAPGGAPDAPFGPVEDVTPAEAVHEVRLRTDAGAGRPVAVWTARPDGTGPGIPLPDVRTVVRSAARFP